MRTNIHEAIAAAGNASNFAHAMLDAMTPYGKETPVQEEVSAETAVPAMGTLAFGMVTQCLDKSTAGRLMVQSKAFPEGPQTCDYVSPIGGAGYGLFAVPGVGSIVLVGKNPYHDGYAKYFWCGCLYAPGQREIPGIKTQPYALGKEYEKNLVKNEVQDNGEPIPDDPTVGFGVPNESDIYKDNYLPDSFVLKHPAGHSISLTDKVTPDRTINEMKLKTAGNKRLIMSDAPTADGGENIHLIDENNNGIRITSVGNEEITENSISTHAGGDVDVYSKEGHMSQVISRESKGHMTFTNAGAGNVDISSNGGEITLEAEKKITLKCGSCSITLSKDTIDIDAPTVNLTGGKGDVSIQGVTLLTHKHIVPVHSAFGIGVAVAPPTITTVGR